MKRYIQLHDGALEGVFCDETSTVLTFSAVIIHETAGIPRQNDGRAWWQSATLTFSRSAQVHLPTEFPIWVVSGTLKVGDAAYEEFLPTDGCFDGGVEFNAVLSTQDGGPGGLLRIHAGRVCIQLSEEPDHGEEYRGWANS